MKKVRVFKIAGKVFILFSALGLLSVSLLAWYDPQMVMSLVDVELHNNDALSSIRGVYGGVGISVCLMLIYFMISDVRKGLVFLSLFWGLYAFSRLLTIFANGTLGEFGSHWLKIESVLCFISLTLLINFQFLENTKKTITHEKI